MITETRSNNKTRAVKREEAYNIILKYALSASGACGVFKIFVPIPFLEVGALTLITKKMCSELTAIYGYESLSGMGMLYGVAIGAFSGAQLAAGILDFVPFIGACSNAIATCMLHTVTGLSMIIICEHLEDGVLSATDVKDSPWEIINSISTCVVGLVGAFLRGDISNAIDSGKEASRLWKLHSDIPIVHSMIHDDAKKAVITTVDQCASIAKSVYDIKTSKA